MAKTTYFAVPVFVFLLSQAKLYGEYHINMYIPGGMSLLKIPVKTGIQKALINIG